MNVHPDVIVEWSCDDDAFVAFTRDLPTVKVHGATMLEAVAELGVALRLASRVLVQDGHILISETSGRFVG